MSGSQATAGIARHFEGWQLGLLAVGVAAGALWLGLPRPVEPGLVPLPEVDRVVIGRARREEAERAREAERTRLPLPVRAVGELFRRHGACVAAQNARCAREAREDARQLAATVVHEQGAAPLERLRAAQTELFLDAVRGLRAKARQSRCASRAEVGQDQSSLTRRPFGLWQRPAGRLPRLPRQATCRSPGCRENHPRRML